MLVIVKTFLTYINIKKKKCIELGIDCDIYSFQEDTDENNIIKKILELNDDINVNGIMVQLPLPKRYNQLNILSKISVNKDVDGLHPYNLGLLMMNKEPVYYPCTPLGIIELLDYYKINIKKKNIVFVGSGMVNLPLSVMLLNKQAGSITLCNENTENIKEKNATSRYFNCGLWTTKNDKIRLDKKKCYYNRCRNK